MTKRRDQYAFFLSVILISVGLLQPALGQINPFRGAKGEPMKQADINALVEATNRLLDRPDLVPGGEETWSNPESGAGGTITAGKALTRHNLSCRTVQYVINGPGTRPQRNYTKVWCKTPDGWKLG